MNSKRKKSKPAIKKSARQEKVKPELTKKQLYCNRYYALLYVYGLSIVFATIWGFTRWMWIQAEDTPQIGGFIPLILIPLCLTGLHLFMCRHYIRAIHDNIERFMWIIIPILSFLLFCSAGEYAEIRFYPYSNGSSLGQSMAKIWQAILLFEGIVLFLVYRSYYVITEYEDSVTRDPSERVIHGRMLSAFLIFIIIPFLMVVTHLCVLSDPLSRHATNSSALVEWGSLQFSLVIERGEWWRLITCAFLHGSFTHLGSNLLCYYFCTVVLFRRHNGFHIFGIFMFSVIISSISVLMFSQHNTVGASGGVFGLMSFWAMDALRYAKKEEAQNDMKHKVQLKNTDDESINSELSTILTMLGQNLILSFKAGISTSAHFGGFFAGIAIGGLSYLWPILAWLIASIAVVLIMTFVYSNRGIILDYHKSMMPKRTTSVQQKNNDRPKSYEIKIARADRPPML